MRALLVLAAALVLAACATPAPAPSPIAAAPVQARSAGIATLAFGPWEQELAPAVTRAEVVARLAAAQVRDGRLATATGEAIRAHLAAARAALYQARRGGGATPTPDQRAAMAEAIRLTDLAAHLLEP